MRREQLCATILATAIVLLSLTRATTSAEGAEAWVETLKHAPHRPPFQGLGTLFVRRKESGSLTPIGLQEDLFAGDWTGTDDISQATLITSKGNEIRIDYHSAVAIGRNGQWQLLNGSLWASLVGSMNIGTPGAHVRNKRTEFHLQVETDGKTTVTVLKGEVDFFNSLGSEKVGELQQSEATPTSSPTKPRTISLQQAESIIEWSLELDRALVPRENFHITPDPQTLGDELQRRSQRVREQPADPAARRDYGDVLFDSRRYEDALKQYEEADRLALGQRDTLLRLGYTLLELGRLDEAEASFSAARSARGETKPEERSFLPVWPGGTLVLRLGLTPAGQHDAVLDTAFEGVDASSSVTPGFPRSSLAGLAWVALARDHAQDAEEFARQAVATDPRSAEAQLVLGLALMRQPGKLAAAETAFGDAKKGEPVAYHYQALSWLALVHLALNNQDTALQEAKAAVDQEPHSALALGNYAMVLLFSDKPREAVRQARLATKIRSDSVAARVALGQALLAGGNVEEAVWAAAQAVALDPKLPQARYLLGTALIQRRDFDHAARELEESLRLAPNFLPSMAELVRVYLARGQRREAEKLVRRASKMAPDYAPAQAALGRVYYAAGQLKEAAEAYERAVEKNPHSLQAQVELARVYLERNDLPAALEHALAGVHQSPGLSEAHAVLGLVYDRQDNREQAEREYREAISLAPDNSLARLGLVTSFTPASFGFFGSGQERLRERAQALLRNPAVLQEVFRPGQNSEISSSYGADRDEALQYLHRGQFLRGRVHDLSVVNGFSNNGYRRNYDHHGHDAQTDIAAQATPTTEVLIQYLDQALNGGLPGPVNQPDLDADARRRRIDYNLHLRQYLGKHTDLWLGFGFRVVRNSREDLDSAADLFRTNARNREQTAELRVDHTVRSHRLTYGLMKLNGKIRFLEDKRFPGSTSLDEELETSNSLADFLQYLQDDIRVGDHGALTVGTELLRTRENTQTLDRVFNPLGVPTAYEPKEEIHTDLLPYLSLTYNFDNRNLIRVLGNQTRVRLGSSLLAPSEAFIIAEPINVLGGQVETYELDYERRISEETFAKLFLQHSLARRFNVQPALDQAFQIPGLTIPKVEEHVAGLRLEQQINGCLSSFVRLQYINALYRAKGSNPYSGLQAPFSPHWSGLVGLNYVNRGGTKLRLTADFSSSEYIDIDQFLTNSSVARPKRASIGPRGVVDLRIAQEPSLKLEYGLTVSNLFNTSIPDWPRFPRPGRLWSVEIARRF